MKYLVQGGVYTDTDFETLVPGTEEVYGPFNSYDLALTAWKRAMFTQKLDICNHRVRIYEMH